MSGDILRSTDHEKRNTTRPDYLNQDLGEAQIIYVDEWPTLVMPGTVRSHLVDDLDGEKTVASKTQERTRVSSVNSVEAVRYAVEAAVAKFMDYPPVEALSRVDVIAAAAVKNLINSEKVSSLEDVVGVMRRFYPDWLVPSEISSYWQEWGQFGRIGDPTYWSMWAEVNVASAKGRPFWANTGIEKEFNGERSAVIRGISFGHVVGYRPEKNLNIFDLGWRVSQVIEAGFPWVDDEGVRRDYLLGTKKVEVLNTDRYMTDYESVSDSVVVVDMRERVWWRNIDRRRCEKLLENNPLMVLLTQDKAGQQLMHIKANHEYIDGIPVGYLAKQLAEKLGGVIEWWEMHDPDLEILLKQADEIENLGATEGDYLVESKVWRKDQIQEINSLYDSLNYKYMELNSAVKPIPFSSFLQLMFLESAGMDGKRVKGGTLAFDPNVRVQLDQFGVNLGLIKLIEALDQEDLELAKSVLNLYDPKRSSIGIIGKATKKIKDIGKQVFMALAVNRGVQVGAAIAGQVLVSAINTKADYAKRHKGAEPIMVAGFGSPAVAPLLRTSSATTLNYELDDQGRLKRLVTRVKKLTGK